jgi:hypothetical protein
MIAPAPRRRRSPRGSRRPRPRRPPPSPPARTSPAGPPASASRSAPRVQSRWRFRKRGTDYISQSGESGRTAARSENANEAYPHPVLPVAELHVKLPAGSPAAKRMLDGIRAHGDPAHVLQPPRARALQQRAAVRREPLHCSGQKPPIWAVKRPTRPYKNAIQK